MNVPTITMKPVDAARKLRAYQQQLRRRADAQYEACAQGYAVLAKGTPLLNLTQAFRAGGYGDDGLPKFAIARSDRIIVSCSRQYNGVFRFSCESRMKQPQLRRVINMGKPAPRGADTPYGSTLVPMVPADVRPNVDLRKCWTLFEVEQWTLTPSRDPLLLKPLGGDLYAVLAAWELTDLERAVMSAGV